VFLSVSRSETLSDRNYSMAATMTQDAELGLWSRRAFDSLLRHHPDYCHTLVEIVGEKMRENQKIAKALLIKDVVPTQKSCVV